MSQVKGAGSNLLQALLSIHFQKARLITSPPVLAGNNSGASRRASVAISELFT